MSFNVVRLTFGCALALFLMPHSFAFLPFPGRCFYKVPSLVDVRYLSASASASEPPIANANAAAAAAASATTTTTGVVISPFDSSNDLEEEWGSAGDDEKLALTEKNVEMVLDEMRPYLEADGGNVALSEIDGPVVKVELQGACGTCPSSSMTLKMGLERRLKERIPEISEVVQSIPEAPDLTEEAVDGVLDGVRPFLAVAGGEISIESITGIGGLQPCVALKMEGSATALQSVKLEIQQRIQRHFMQSLRIEWR